MPQFSMIPERRSILKKIPDYSITTEPACGVVTVTYDSTRLAGSRKALLVHESKHAAVLYLPREDINVSLFHKSDHTTYCPFKGHASYWTLNLSGLVEENVVWSYETPYAEVAQLKNHMAFYSSRVDVAFDPD